MTKDQYDLILTLINENGALKQKTVDELATALGEMYERDNSTSRRIARLRDTLAAVSGFKGGDSISRGVAGYAIDVDDHDLLTLRGKVASEVENARIAYARTAVDGFMAVVMLGRT